MNASAFGFRLLARDAGARRGVLRSPHGVVQTPTFMPVATQATVKGVAVESLRPAGVEMLLANTYHLALRPGADVVERQGGLHRFMGWDGPILTDSGGFQVFSLAHINRVTEEGVQFRSHIDGRTVALSPERAIALQQQLGSDVAMVLDHVVALPAEADRVADACERSIRWARRCRDVPAKADQVLFGIVQGGLDVELRARSAEALVRIGFAGYAIGGLSVGETPEEMYRILDATAPALPEGQPRYLMGVGRPQDLLEGIARGVDLFDCVMPTRNGRNAMAFTDAGPVRLRNRCHQDDERPLEEGCPCPACRRSRGYLRHLFIAGELLGPTLLSLHNITYYERLLARTRAAIEAGTFATFKDERMRAWAAGASADSAEQAT